MVFLRSRAMLQAATDVAWGGMTRMPGYTEIRVAGTVTGMAPTFARQVRDSVPHRSRSPWNCWSLWFADADLAKRLSRHLASPSISHQPRAGGTGKLLAMVAHQRSVQQSPYIAWPRSPSQRSPHSTISDERGQHREASASSDRGVWEQGLTMLRDSPCLRSRSRSVVKHYIQPASWLTTTAVQNFAEAGFLGFSRRHDLFAWRQALCSSNSQDPAE